MLQNEEAQLEQQLQQPNTNLDLKSKDLSNGSQADGISVDSTKPLHGSSSSVNAGPILGSGHCHREEQQRLFPAALNSIQLTVNTSGVSSSSKTPSRSQTTASMPQEHGLVIRIDRLSTSTRGRIMQAGSFIPRGTLLTTVLPQAGVCDAENRRKRCGGCLGPLLYSDISGGIPGHSAMPVSCEGCGEIWYCDDACKTQDRESVHELECAFLRELHHTAEETKSKEDAGTDDKSASGIEISIINVQEREDTPSLPPCHPRSRHRLGLQDKHQRAVGHYLSLSMYAQEYCRLLIRVLVHRFKEFLPRSEAEQELRHLQGQGNEDAPLPFANVADLVDNRSNFAKDTWEGEMTDVAQVLDAFQEFLQLSHKTKDDEEQEKVCKLSMDGLMDLIAKEECNSFGLYEYPPLPSSSTTATTPSSTTNAKLSYGIGLFIRHYLYGLNHSCSPNLYHVAHKSGLLLYAARDIAQGEELNIAYTEFGPTYRTFVDHRGQDSEQEAARKRELYKRRKHMMDHFYFDCRCRRCVWELSLEKTASSSEAIRNDASEFEAVEEDKFLREGLMCERAGCYGFYAPPEVLNILRGSKEGERGQGDEPWDCVACDHQQTSF